MSQDQLTYTRASTASLIGLAMQFVLALLLIILGLYAESKAVLAVAFYSLPGLAIWLLLWLIYKQHQLERAEALEASKLAESDARSAALFEEAGSQLAQAKARLDTLYKWGVRIISGLSAVYLIGVGTLLLYLNNTALSVGTLEEAPLSENVNTSLFLLLLVVGWMGGFLVARYVAGMTRVDSWQALRGGASTLIGNVFLGVLPIIAAAVLLFFGNSFGFVYLAIIIPAIMVLLGIEIVLGMVLSFYRPRKGDEFVRPAFDSRLLGWLTRPESIGKIFSETLNYQFGFEVSKSWFMRLLGKALLPLAGVCLVVVIGMTSLVIVQPHQQAIVTSNGAFVRIAEPGLSFKTPWPFGHAEKFDVKRIHSVRLGSRAHIDDEHKIQGPLLWTNPHVEEGATEELLITAPPPGAGTTGTKDSVLGEMIGADIDVKYRIADLRLYAGIDEPTAGTTDPEKLLQTIAQHEVTRYFATNDTDALLSSGRVTAGSDLQAAIQDELDKYSVGLEIVFVSVSGVHPPQEVADDYHARINALQESQTAEARALQEADIIYATVAGDRDRADRLIALVEQYNEINSSIKQLDKDSDERKTLEESAARQRAAIELLMIECGGEVGQRMAQARATRWSQALGAEARDKRLAAELKAYESAPRYYPVSRYLDALVAGLENRPKTVLGSDAELDNPEVVLDLPLGGGSSGSTPR
jgi:regulator of protease activity HflC (stomatin/prohibitin superfamily)